MQFKAYDGPFQAVVIEPQTLSNGLRDLRAINGLSEAPCNVFSGRDVFEARRRSEKENASRQSGQGETRRVIRYPKVLGL